METQHPKKAGIWIDQSHATLIGFFENHPCTVEEIESPIESHVRYEGETSDKTQFMNAQVGSFNNEKKRNNIEENQLKKYFNELEEKVVGIKELLLIGPGITKNQFFKQINNNKKFQGTRIIMKDANKMTQNQLFAMVRDHFTYES
ncbi:hypothetical protein DFQ04_2655 [Algoriphagus boseongensis]|uniref:Protein required for attachment to host cells n=1 Tax=Algoriphagus boseongensis TaxID=1442587 RepID=A0A4R6T3G6_9BACT|nr:hypothetical protein [Algoriphagus boseongensis]TDQ16536.1 hypothetical protein DFQ04_2655 [Algoriphagus boseongensis]